MYTLKRAPSKLTTAAARELTVITFSFFFFFYFKDGSLSFAILCSTSIRLIYRYYTCNESARFCHNLYRCTSLRDPPYASLPDRRERVTSGWSTPLSGDTIGDTRKLSLAFRIQSIGCLECLRYFGSGPISQRVGGVAVGSLVSVEARRCWQLRCS